MTDPWLVIPTAERYPDLLAGIIENAGIPTDRIVLVATTPSAALGRPAGVRRVADFRGPNIQAWWNRGIDLAVDLGAEQVAVFNDDLRITPDVIPAMSARLSETGAVLCCVGTLAYPAAPMTGWAWMLDATRGIRPDESYRWYYGDTDLWDRAASAAGGVCAVDLTVEHLHPGRATTSRPELEALAEHDRLLYQARRGMPA